MSIKKIDENGNVEHLFQGRVIRVENTTERRNWSDTLDYSDYRDTLCVYALVWLGVHGVPPRTDRVRPLASHEPASWDKPRDLDFSEQFAWVDCTNLFAYLNGFRLIAEVDGEYGLFGEPLMWANLVAWESYHKGLAEKNKASAEAARKLEEEKVLLRAKEMAEVVAKKAAKEASSKAAAEAMLAHAPKKGTTVTVDGFTGQVFWTGVSKYRGKFNARVGVKNSKGTVSWIDAAHWVK